MLPYTINRNENYNIIQNDRTDVFSWKRVYTYAIDALKSAKKSVYAVDFTPPQLWIAPAGIMSDYRQAHPASLPSEQKIRVHGFIESQLESNTRAYMTFIAQHQEMGVQVFFIEKTEIRLRDITQGFVLIDDKVVFSSRDVQEFADRKTITVEDLLHLTESGFVSFEANAVKTYKSRFDNLLRIDASRILTAEKFKERLAKYIKPGSAPVQ